MEIFDAGALHCASVLAEAVTVAQLAPVRIRRNKALLCALYHLS